MKRLPPGFDLTRLPPSLIASVAAGQPFDLTQMPPDMLAAFRDFNPDLKQQIDEALNRPKLKNGVFCLIYVVFLIKFIIF
jgi:hypothetical protein